MCGFVDKFPSVGPKQDADVNLFLQKCAVLIHGFFLSLAALFVSGN